MDFPLGSISEDIEGEVFIAPPPEETIGNEGVEEGVKSDDEGEEDALCVDKELVIQFLPNEVIISDDVTYNYESSNSDSSILDSLMEKLPPHRSDLNIEEPVQAETHTVHRTETETTDPRSHSDELAFVPDQSFGREHPSCISTPAQCHSRPSSRLSSTASSIGGPDGFYTGYARHKDGSLLSIIFQVSKCNSHAVTDSKWIANLETCPTFIKFIFQGYSLNVTNGSLDNCELTSSLLTLS